MTDKDRAVIPAGGFCYRVVPIADGEVLSDDVALYGKDLREFRYGPDRKQIACPYFEFTDYGTVRCIFMEVEVRGDRDLINAHFNDVYAADRFPMSHFLVDEIQGVQRQQGLGR